MAKPEAGRSAPTDSSELERQLGRVFEVVLEQVRRDSDFARRLARALAGSSAAAKTPPAPAESASLPPAAPAPEPRPSTTTRATPAPAAAATVPAPVRRRAVIDPFALYDAGWEEMLRSHLARLTIDQLRDVIHQYQLDSRSRTAAEADVERLRDWIVRSVEDLGSGSGAPRSR